MNAITLLSLPWHVYILISLIPLTIIAYFVEKKYVKILDYLSKTEEVIIEGGIIEVIDQQTLISNTNQQQDLFPVASPVVLDKKGNPIVLHNYSFNLEQNYFQYKNKKLYISLKEELFKPIKQVYEEGGRYIKIKCTRWLHSGKLKGKEILIL